MASVSTLLLLDAHTRRRAAICHALSRSHVHVEPFENVAELAGAWPRSGVILVHDDVGAIDELIEAMAEHGEWFPIIAFGEEPDDRSIVRAVLDGAIDYIVWPIDADELKDRIDSSIARAARIGSAKLREVMARASIERLTRREREVLGGVASGLSNRLIGQKLAISPRTVEIHRANMLSKLGAHHTSDAIRIAIEAALVH